jgi:hypothetical protein
MTFGVKPRRNGRSSQLAPPPLVSTCSLIHAAAARAPSLNEWRLTMSDSSDSPVR